MRVTFIVGLPGSGKTTLAEEMANASGGIIVDDPRQLDEVREALRSGQDVIITDPQLCIPSLRVAAENFIREEAPEAEISWIFFENNPEACRQNAATRENKPVDGSIHVLSHLYQIPEDADVRPVFQMNPSRRIGGR